MNLNEFYRALDEQYENVLSRLPSEKLILKYITRFPSDQTLEQFFAAVNAADWPAAFRAVHTLKGLYLNLGFLKPLKNTSAVTEMLRNDSAPSNETEFRTRTAQLKAEYDHLISLISVLQS